VRLTILGCAGSFPGPDSAASCYLVEAAGVRVLLDLGSGALSAVQRHVDLDGLDAILISHLHPDRYLDLCGLYVARKYRPDGPAASVVVYGPADAADQVAAAYGVPADPGVRDQLDFRTYPDGAFHVGPLRVVATPVDHPVEAFGLRLEHAGRVLAYSGDTGPCDALVQLAKGADLFLCEASFHEGRDSATGMHLTGRQAAEYAGAAGAGLLVLTHIPAWNDPRRALIEARAAFDGRIELARPDESYDL
jgi:ribonuclease BN (tRNA processing enzyme)